MPTTQCKLCFGHFYLETRLNCEHFEIHKSPRAHDCGFGSGAVCDSAAVVRSRPSSFRTAWGEQKEWTKKWFARLNWSASQQHSRQIGCETLVLLSFSTNTRDIEADRTNRLMGFNSSTHKTERFIKCSE